MSKRSGYLFLECAVVIALIVFLATLAVSLNDVVDKAEVLGEGRRIAAFLRYQWMRAQSDGRDFEVIIDEKNRQLKANNEVLTLASNVAFGFLSKAYGPPSRPIKPLSSSSTFKDNKIIFYNDGSVSAGSLYIIDKKKKYLYAITIPIPDSFYIRIYAWGRSVWKVV